MQLQRAKNMNQTRKRASIMGARDMMHLVSRSKAAVTEPTATRREFAPDRAKRVRTDPPQRSPENIEKRPANLEASLALGPPGPIAAPQYAPAPWPQADVDSGIVFRDEPPPFTDVQRVCNVRSPACWIRTCPRVNRTGYRRVHEHHMCNQCHAHAKRLNSSRT